jgi:hypothetical protein
VKEGPISGGTHFFLTCMPKLFEIIPGPPLRRYGLPYNIREKFWEKAAVVIKPPAFIGKFLVFKVYSIWLKRWVNNEVDKLTSWLSDDKVSYF